MTVAAAEAAPEITLTVQELEAAHHASFDLGPGYPQIAPPAYVRELYLDDRIEELSLHFAPFWTPQKQSLIDVELTTAVSGFLSIPTNRYDAMRPTFSGSVALDRGLTAVTNEARAAGATGLDVVTTSPSIDIMRLFLQEHGMIRPHFVRSRLGGEMGALDLELVLRTLEKVASGRSNRRQLVLLTSPENPTGECWSRDDLVTIARACSERQATLLVDHTFIVAGVQEAVVPRIWDVAPPELDWIGVWDTGKTFGLNEDKLGFLLTGTSRMTSAVDEALAVMQFGVARRQKLFFAEVIRRAMLYDHVHDLRSICVANLACLTQLIEASPLRARVPVATSMVLLDCADLGRSDEELRQRLLRAHVGVIAGNVFFHDAWRPTNYVRLALARDEHHFEASSQALMREVARWDRRRRA